jgi:hypothetical protein
MNPTSPLFVHRYCLIRQPGLSLDIDIEHQRVNRPVILPFSIHRHLTVRNLRVGFRVTAQAQGCLLADPHSFEFGRERLWLFRHGQVRVFLVHFICSLQHSAFRDENVFILVRCRYSTDTRAWFAIIIMTISQTVPFPIYTNGT